MAIRVLTVDDSILFRTVIKNGFSKINDIDIIDDGNIFYDNTKKKVKKYMIEQ